MTMRHVVHSVSVALSMVMCVAPLHAQRVSVEPAIAHVDRDRIEFLLPRPVENDQFTIKDARGHHIWRIVIDDRSDVSFVLAADTAMSNHDLRAVLQASRLRSCAQPGVLSALECTAPLTGQVTLKQTKISLLITDTAFVERIRRIRPVFFWLRAFAPIGRFQEQTVQFNYRDKPLRE